MTREGYSAALKDAAWLAACAVKVEAPDPGRVAGMDIDALYEAADRHLLAGITAMALESAGVRDDRFTQAKGKAVRKAAAFDIELAAVLAKLEEEGIWHLPLKGCVIKDLYPRIGMRQMADVDILFDALRCKDVRAIMEGLGYRTERYGTEAHDEYTRPPVFSFEMHRMLFPPDSVFYGYYSEIQSRMIPAEGSGYAFRLSDEDLYVYLIAHECKHYRGSGTGLRSLLDIWVYLRAKEGSLDRDYIGGELEKLGIAEFERRNRLLAARLFDGGELTAQDEELFGYIMSSGTYGSVENNVRNRMDRLGGGRFRKLRYVLSRAFLPMESVRASFPAFARFPVLLPLLPFYRLVRGLTVKRRKMRAELRALRNAQQGDRER